MCLLVCVQNNADDVCGCDAWKRGEGRDAGVGVGVMGGDAVTTGNI